MSRSGKSLVDRAVTKLVLVALLSTAVSILSAAADSSESSRPVGQWIDGEFVSSLGIVIPYQVYIPSGGVSDDYHRFGPSTSPLVVALAVQPVEETAVAAAGRSAAAEPRDPLSVCPECGALISTGVAFDYSALLAVVYLRRDRAGSFWEEELDTLAEVATSGNGLPDVDDRRIYLTGHDSGAVAAWNLAARIPSRIAALAPAGGGADPRLAPRLVPISVWAFHASVDSRPITETRTMIGAIWAAGGHRARYSEFHSGGGKSWLRAWSDPMFLAWLFSQTTVSP